MINLIQTLAILFLDLLGRYDKAKQNKIIKKYYDRLDADACGVLVEQLGGKPEKPATSANSSTRNNTEARE